MKNLICICHLRWDFVWQRPQQLLSRLAKDWRILFVEEPVTDTTAQSPWLETLAAPSPHPLTVVRLHFPAPENYWIGFGGQRTQPLYERLLNDYLRVEGYVDPVLWLYTPMALPFVQSIQPAHLVYDVMDELAAFKGAPADLKENDRQLLQQADVVFTGGVSLYRARLPYAKNLHLFPSGVAIEHFAQAADQSLPLPADLASITQPILGYYGVIDERMDLALLEQVAQRHPQWSIVLLGPILKIDPAELPQAPNLYYLGMKSYAELPAYLAYFAVALVPFAMNESTRYLSPTKTLEYLAAHKPVVATPIPDIVELYGDYVRIGQTPDEFADQIANDLAASPAASPARRKREAELLANYHWDAIAERMDHIIRATTEQT